MILTQVCFKWSISQDVNAMTKCWKLRATLIPSDDAHSFKTSGSTQTTATKEELKLSPVNVATVSKGHCLMIP